MIIVLWLGVRPRAAPCGSDAGVALRKTVRIQRAVRKSWTRPTVDPSCMYHSDSSAILDRCDGRSCDKLAPEAQSVRSVVARCPSRAVSAMLATRTKIVHPGGTIIKVRQRSAVTVCVANNNLFQLRNICLPFWYLNLWRLVGWLSLNEAS